LQSLASRELFARDSVDADRLRDVLKLLLADTNASCILPAMSSNTLREIQMPPGSARFSRRAVAGVVKDDVTLIDADAKAHAASFFYLSVALRHHSQS
jgi:hypothetical protein